VRTLTLTIPVAGFILLLILAIPLVQFYESMGGLSLDSIQEGDIIVLTLHYNVSTRLTDYRFAVYYNGTLLDEASGEQLSPGDSVQVRFKAYEVQDLSLLSIVFSGRIDNLYYIELELHHR
jgi:archaellum component FlaF (FlaF/FlaG flagellin family)